MTKTNKREKKSNDIGERIMWFFRSNRQNIIFISINIVCLAILVASIVLAVLDNKCSLIEWELEPIGVLSQVITAIVAFITSTLGIAISLQKDECWGVSIKEMNNLRVELHYNIVWTIVIAVLLCALNVAFYIMDLFFVTIGLSVVSIIFCIYVVRNEIPLMVKNEKHLFKIVKYRMFRERKSTKDLPKELKEVLKYLLINKNLRYTYENLKTSNETYNRFLILKLLDLLNDAASDLVNIESKPILLKYANNILISITDLIFFKVDLFVILGSDFTTYYHYITHVLFKLNKIPEYADRVTSLVSLILSSLKLDGQNEYKIKFKMSIILSIVTTTIRNGDFSFVKKIQESFSISYLRLGQDDYDSLVFALVSMQMYFLCNHSQNAKQELKTAIEDFISQNYTVNYTDIQSWKSLYKFFSRNFNIDFEKFMYYFNFSENSWDVPKYFEMQMVYLDQQYATLWFVTNLLNSHRVSDYDYSKLCLNDYCKYSLKNIGNKCFDENGRFILSDDMQSILNFYGLGTRPMKLFLFYEGNTHKLFNFINKIKKDDMFAVNSSVEATRNEQIAADYRNAILSAIKAEWGYDSSIKITGNDRYLSLFIERASNAINYDEVMSQALIDSIFNELRKRTHVKTITNETDLKQELDKTSSEKFDYISQSTRFISYSLKNDSVRKRFDEACSQACVVDSHIFYGDLLAKEKSFSFNFELTELSVRELNAEEINEQVEQHKRADGQYVYEGVFFSREEIERYIKEKYAVLNVRFRYIIIINDDGIIIIEL